MGHGGISGFGFGIVEGEVFVNIGISLDDFSQKKMIPILKMKRIIEKTRIPDNKSINRRLELFRLG